nr:hypothetical protein [Tanacetum cinerariifolium]
MAHMLAICNADVPVEFKAPKTSSPAEKKVFKGKNLKASSGCRRKQSLKHTFESKTEASKSKTGHLDKENLSSSALDNNLSHASASTPVVDKLHKEDQQAAGGPTSLGVTSKEGADPQLSSGISTFIHIKSVSLASFTFHFESASGSDASANSTAKADPRKSTPHDSIPHQ